MLDEDWLKGNTVYSFLSLTASNSQPRQAENSVSASQPCSFQLRAKALTPELLCVCALPLAEASARLK